MSNYTVKIFNSFFWNTIFSKIDEVRNMQIEKFVDNFDFISLTLDYWVDSNDVFNCKGLREFQKIQLIKTWFFEEIVFEGFIYSMKPTFSNINIIARDYKGLLLNKVLFSDKNYSSKTLDFILNDLLSNLNSRSSGDTNPEAWDYEIDSPATGITKEFKKGITYFNIFKELGVISNKNWTVKEGKVLFREILGSDKTSGDNFTELIYNKNAPDENNISKMTVDRFGTLRNTILTSITSSSDATSLATYWRLETYEDIAGSELTNKLDRLKEPQKKHAFVVDYSKINTELELGDKIYVNINSGIDFLDIAGDLFINRIKKRILWNSQVLVDVDVSEINIEEANDFRLTLNDLNEKVKKLLL